ncbi:MAG: hypothetical protein NQ127_03450 [Candidatus Cardinium sp.]|nr:hypothetical protein [Candidatus Cardinium sp.]
MQHNFNRIVVGLLLTSAVTACQMNRQNMADKRRSLPRELYYEISESARGVSSYKLWSSCSLMREYIEKKYNTEKKRSYFQLIKQLYNKYTDRFNKLQVLSLEDIGFFPGANPLEIDIAFAVLAGNNSIKTIDSQGSIVDRIGYEDQKALANALAKALESNKTITAFSINSDRISYLVAGAIAKALEKNNTIETISLCCDKIMTIDAKAIAKALEKNETITTISLCCNYIFDEGAAAIAKALEINKTIRTIDLSNNYIRAVAFKAIAKALEKNETITTISLCCNYIFDEGAAAIAKALEINKTIRTIDLSHNYIGAVGFKAIAKALEKNETITTIDLEYNKIGYEDAKALVKVSKRKGINLFIGRQLSSNNRCIRFLGMPVATKRGAGATAKKRLVEIIKYWEIISLLFCVGIGYAVYTSLIISPSNAP